MNSKIADEMIRELNSLIVQAKETAADTKKQKDVVGDAAVVYAQVWDFASFQISKRNLERRQSFSETCQRMRLGLL